MRKKQPSDAFKKVLVLALEGESASRVRCESGSRVRCTTTGSAKGVEAEHVFFVFHPRHSNDDLGGIQRDKNRFY